MNETFLFPVNVSIEYNKQVYLLFYTMCQTWKTTFCPAAKHKLDIFSENLQHVGLTGMLCNK